MTRSAVKQFYEENASKYASDFYTIPRWNSFRQFVASQIPTLPTAPRIVDIGCGPCPSLPSLTKNASCYVALDGSRANLFAIQKSTGSVIPVQIELESESALPLHTGFDLAICFGIFQYLGTPRILVEQIADILKPGGYLLIHNPSDYWTPHMGKLHGRGLNRQELLSLISGSFDPVWFYSFHHVELERFFTIWLSRLPIAPSLVRIVWWNLFRLEKQLSRLGNVGTDWLMIARRR